MRLREKADSAVNANQSLHAPNLGNVVQRNPDAIVREHGEVIFVEHMVRNNYLNGQTTTTRCYLMFCKHYLYFVQLAAISAVQCIFHGKHYICQSIILYFLCLQH